MAGSEWTEAMAGNWVGMQKQYWETWGNMMKAANAQPQTSMNMPPWGTTMADWWNNSASVAPGDVNDVMSRVSDMGKMYMSMAEMMYKSFNNLTDNSDKDPLELWMSLMDGGFGDWAKQIALGNVPDYGVGVGQMNFEGWQKVLKSLGMDSMPNLGSFDFANSQSWQDQLRKMLSTPGVGYNRESQEQLQELGTLMMDYQNAQNDYLEAFAKQGMDSMQALREKVAGLASEGKEIKTLRELFDLWVNVNEQVYGEFAMSDEYQVVYGDMVNAFMRLKTGINDQVEVLYKAANLPTRSEFNASLRKQQELKRENRKLNQALRSMHRRLDALEEGIVATGESAPRAAAASKPQSAQASEDDLTRIKGLGDKMSEKLYDMGIKTFMELSEVPLGQLEELDKTLGSRGRLLRDDWVGQAKAFLNQGKS